MNAWRRQLLRGLAVTLVGVAIAAGCASDEKPSPAAVSYEDNVSKDAAIDPGNAAYVGGSIVYLQRIALPRGSTVVVEMLDISMDDPSSRRIARQQFATEQQVPIPFQLAYDKGRIDPGRSYGVRARILVDGAVWFVNEQPQPVLTRGNPSSVQIVVRPASAGPGG